MKTHLLLRYNTMRPDHRTFRYALAVLIASFATVQVAPAQLSADHGTGTLSALPLEPTQTVRFEVTEGTWMSLDVSPDGQTVVFDLLGDLYTLPITGGRATRITSGTAYDKQPRYSPDGTRIAFVSDRSGNENVWVARTDGSDLRKLSRLQPGRFGAVRSPAWSPDGQTILVSQSPTATTNAGDAGMDSRLDDMWLLASYSVDSGEMQWVVDTSPESARSMLGPAFGPDIGTVYIAVLPVDAGSLLGYPLDSWRVGRLDLATGHLEALMGFGVGRNGLRPAVSPDGHYLVYVSSSGSRYGFRLRDLRTGRERWLVQDVLDPVHGYPLPMRNDLAPGYAFTPDSRSVVAAYEGKFHRIDIQYGRVEVIPFNTEVEKEISALNIYEFALPDTAARTRSVNYPALSPDGSKVAFRALSRIWILELPYDSQASSAPQRLTADSWGEFFPSWSPDGDWIVYSTWQDGQGGAIRRADVGAAIAGKAAPSERLSRDTAQYFHTAVAPDGRSIIAVRGSYPKEGHLPIAGRDTSKMSLVSIPISGGRPIYVAPLGGAQGQLRHYPFDPLYFAGEPERIYLGLSSWSLHHMDYGVPLLAQERVDPYSTLLEGSGVVSPDGRRALVHRAYDLLEVILPEADDRVQSSQDLLELSRASLGAGGAAIHRWRSALIPWVSWSRNGQRVVFNQGGTLYVGDVPSSGPTEFRRVEVPLWVSPDIPDGVLVLRNARLVTMREDEVIEPGELVIRGNRIVTVGLVGQVNVPEGAQIIDAMGTTIIPGYIDLHDHLRLPAGLHADQCWQCLVRLAHGITTSRDPNPTGRTDIFAYRERERTGELVSPRIFSTGPTYQANEAAEQRIRSFADALDLLRPYVEDFSTESFKLHVGGGRREQQLLAAASRQLRINTTVHINSLGEAMTAAIDGISGLEHRPWDVHGLYGDVTNLLARSQVTYTQTYGVQPGGWSSVFSRYPRPDEVPKMRRFIPASAWSFVSRRNGGGGHYWWWRGIPELDQVFPILSGAHRIAASGGRIGIGSHGDIPGLGFHYEMWLHALGGMPPHEILRSATIRGAEAIGHANDFGSLAPGKLADLQILVKNPLEDIRHTTSIRYVMKNGRLYEAEDLTEIWPYYKRLPALYLDGAYSGEVIQ